MKSLLRIVFLLLCLGVFVGILSTLRVPDPAIVEKASNPTVIVGKEGWLFPGWESLTTANTAGVDSSIALIRYAKERLADRGVGLVVLIVPLKARFYGDRLPSDRAVSFKVNARYPYILSALSSATIDTLDAIPILQSAEHDQQTAFYRADYHWTSWAAEAVGDKVAELIKTKWSLKGKAGTGDILGAWTSERQFGDLAANFLTLEQRQAIGRDTYFVRQQAKSAEGLLQNSFAPVHVIGDSSVQPYFGFPQKLSNMLDRPVTLNWNVGDIGPWVTFLEYVESPSFKENKPQVVVWEFTEGRFLSDPAAVGEWRPSSVMSAATWRERVDKALRRNP
jgi:alginate O-acetyltransferase complex protein AlgJ